MPELVSIIIPVYNAEPYIKEAILSAVNQTYKNIEILIIDDGSTDNSLEIAQTFKDSRIKIVSQKNQGGSIARNQGIHIAQGHYIKFLDADDTLEPNAIENQIACMENLKENELVFGDFNFINQKGEITGNNTFNEQKLLDTDPVSFFLSNWKILISCPLHRAKILKNIGGFDEKLPFGQESDLHFRLAIINIKFIYEAGIVFNYRSYISDDRVSVNRVSGNKNIEAAVYSLEKKINLIKSKQTRLNAAQKNYFSLAYFGYARMFFIKKQKKEGLYHLALSRKYAKMSIPPFKRKTVYGLVYLMLGNLIGFPKLEAIIAGIKPANAPKEEEIDMLFKQ